MTPALLRDLAAVLRADALHKNEQPEWDEWAGRAYDHEEPSLSTAETDRRLARAADLDAEADDAELRSTGKRCSCGAIFTVSAWCALPIVGVQSLGLGERIELRNCPSCKSTLGIHLPAAEAA